MQNPDPMFNEEELNKDVKTDKRKLLLMGIAVVLAICLFATAIVSVINTIRNDNPTSSTVSTADTAALAEAAKNTVAITVGSHNLNAVELNYYYVDTINNFCNEYYYYIYYYGMIDTSKPLNEQYFDKENNISWANYFLDLAKSNIQSTYAMYDLAVKDGLKLTDDQQKQLDELADYIRQTAASAKYENVDSYLEVIYGYGSDLESYLAYCECSMLADAYYSQYADSLVYTDAQLREHEKDSAHEYNAYNFAVYYLQCSKFLTGGTEDSDGKVTYTDEQKAAAIAAATEAANALNGNSCADLDAFKEMILGMDIHSGLSSVSVTEQKDTFYSSIDPSFQKWIIDESRVHGDVTVVAKKTTDANKNEVIEGYYVLWYDGYHDNTMMLKDVRHILVLFKNADGKTYSDGVTTFTDEQKATAKAAAEALLAQWKAGEMTEDSFAQLAIKNSEDGGSASAGGLYTKIYPGQMVENFEAWCYDENRQVGDTGLVESVYGYHIMYFIGDSDINYRDFMVSYNKRSADLNAWHKALVDAMNLTEVCLDYCQLDMKLGG